MKIVWGIVWILLGIGIMKYTFTIVQTFGKIPWAESKLGGGMGGTYTLWKFIGVAIIFFAMLYMFGGFGLITKPFVPLFGGSQV